MTWQQTGYCALTFEISDLKITFASAFRCWCFSAVKIKVALLSSTHQPRKNDKYQLRNGHGYQTLFTDTFKLTRFV